MRCPLWSSARVGSCFWEVTATYWEATINNAGSYGYRIDLKDLGEPGTRDTYRIVLSNGYDSGERTIEGGNVQIHK